MHAPFEESAEEIKCLQRCINDLVSVLALPAMWADAEPSQVIISLADAPMRVLDVEFVFARLR
jgi:hypothetical protein